MKKIEIIDSIRSKPSDEVAEKRTLIRELMRGYRMSRVPVYFPKIYRVRTVEHPGLFTDVEFNA